MAISQYDNEYYGLSGDVKPLGTPLNGRKFTEMDTSKEYRFDAENQQWLQQSGGGGGSSTLSGLTDVDISNPTDGQTLVYNATSGKWENGSGGGYKVFEVTFMAVEHEYDFSCSAIAITPDGVTVSPYQGSVNVQSPVTLKLVSFSDSLLISLRTFDISESYMPVCTGGVELDLESLGFMVSGDGTITCEGPDHS